MSITYFDRNNSVNKKKCRDGLCEMFQIPLALLGFLASGRCRCSGWAGDIYLGGEGQKCPWPLVFGHHEDHELTQVCRLLRPIMLRDKLCHLLKTHCSSGKKMLTLPWQLSTSSSSRRKGMQRVLLWCFSVPQGMQFWLQNLLVESTAGSSGTTTVSQQVPYPPSSSLPIKLLEMLSLNPMGWRWDLCRGRVLSLLWAGGFSVVFLKEIFTNLTVLCCRTTWTDMSI